MQKFILSFYLIFFIGCMYKPAPIVGPPGPPGLQGSPGQKGESIPKDLILGLEKQLEIISNSKQTAIEEIVGIAHYIFGIAPPRVGFLSLTSFGNLYQLENKNPITRGDVFSLLTRIDIRNDFVSLTVLPGSNDIQQSFLAITKNGESYESADLKSWSHKEGIPLEQ